MSAHTPGPWFAVQPEHAAGWWVVSTDQRGENSVDESGDGGFHESTARLIAAAPELLEALTGLAGAYKSLCEMTGKDFHVSDVSHYAAARAAIAKAKGETP